MMMVKPRQEDKAVGVDGSGLVGTRYAERPESSSVKDHGNLAMCRGIPTGRGCTGLVDYPLEKRDFCL